MLQTYAGAIANFITAATSNLLQEYHTCRRKKVIPTRQQGISKNAMRGDDEDGYKQAKFPALLILTTDDQSTIIIPEHNKCFLEVQCHVAT